MRQQKRTNRSNNRIDKDYKITPIIIPDGGCMYYVYHYKIGFGAIFNTIDDARRLFDYYGRRYY